MGVSAGEGYSTPVIDFDYETFKKEAIRLGEGGGDNVGEGFDYGLGLGVRGGGGMNSEETTGGIRERGTFLRGLSSLLATSGAETCLPFMAQELVPEPAAWA